MKAVLFLDQSVRRNKKEKKKDGKKDKEKQAERAAEESKRVKKKKTRKDRPSKAQTSNMMDATRMEKDLLTKDDEYRKLKSNDGPDQLTADALPEAWKAALSPQSEKVVERFVADYMQLGVQGIRAEFAQHKTFVPALFDYSSFTANPERNRYKDVVCLENTRINLTLLSPPETNYIHANRVRLEGAEKAFITCQGPLEGTIGDHWRLVHQEEVSVIAALSQFVEAGKAKCTSYWPMRADESATYGKMTVTTKKVVAENGFDIYTVEALPEGCSNSTIVKLIHMTSWPDRGVPKDAKVLLHLLKLIHFNAQGNIIVHCSAGIGRTGTVLAVDCIVNRLLKGRETKLLDVFKDLRGQRASAVQTESQYALIIQAVMEFIVIKTGSKYSEQVKKFNEEVIKSNLA